MNPQTSTRAKDFFLNLGSTVALYTVVVSLVNLLFTVINTAYPKITNANYYAGSTSISWPVAILIIFTPILILLMRLLGKQYATEAASTIHKWLSYLTLFLAGIAIAADLITVLYYFIDGQELGTAFLLKVLVLLVVSGGIFGYYLSDIQGKLNPKSRMIWRWLSIGVIAASIVWGFSVLGTPHTQRLYKYDSQKISDLQNINYQIQSYYQQHGSIPTDLSEVYDTTGGKSSLVPVDAQSQQPYEYHLIGQSAKAYELCAEFNFASDAVRAPIASYAYDVSMTTWNHDAGHYCFKLSIPLDQYRKLPL